MNTLTCFVLVLENGIWALTWEVNLALVDLAAMSAEMLVAAGELWVLQTGVVASVYAAHRMMVLGAVFWIVLLVFFFVERRLEVIFLQAGAEWWWKH